MSLGGAIRSAGLLVHGATRPLKPEIARVFAENFAVYGVRKVWRQMRRDGHAVAAVRSSG